MTKILKKVPQYYYNFTDEGRFFMKYINVGDDLYRSIGIKELKEGNKFEVFEYYFGDKCVASEHKTLLEAIKEADSRVKYYEKEREEFLEKISNNEDETVKKTNKK